MPTAPARRPPAQPVQPQPLPASGGNTAAAALVLLPTAGELAGGGVAGAAATKATARLVTALRRLSRLRASALAVYIEDAYRQVRPSAPPREIRTALSVERYYEVEFRRKQDARVRRDMPGALAKGEAGVRALLDRERRYGHAREEAAADRAAGRADAVDVRELSPEGCWWQLGHRLTHTPDCVALANKAHRWEALEAERMIPPVGPGCGCRLRPLSERYVLTGRMPEVPTIAQDRAIIRAAKRLPGHGPAS